MTAKTYPLSAITALSVLATNAQDIDEDVLPSDRRKQQERIVRVKQQILDFLTGAENSDSSACRFRCAAEKERRF